MSEFMEAAGGGAMDTLTFLGDVTNGSWLYAPVVYFAVFHEPTTRRMVRLFRAIRSGKDEPTS